MSGGSKDSRSGAHALPSTSLPCRPVACDGVASSSNLAGRSALSAGRFAAQGAQKMHEGVNSDVRTDGTEHQHADQGDHSDDSEVVAVGST